MPEDARYEHTAVWQDPRHWPGFDLRCATCFAQGYPCQRGHRETLTLDLDAEVLDAAEVHHAQ